MTTIVVGGGILGACTLHELARAGEDAEARERTPVDSIEPGAWSKKLAAAVGLELPLEIPREQDVIVEGGTTIRHAISLSSMSARPGRLLAGRGYPKDDELVDPDAYDENVDAAFEADVLARVRRRLPAANGLRRVDGRVGLYEVTPDWHPILGAVDGYDGLFLATGGSGHCSKP